MMNNFTPRAQQVLALGRKEAERFNHNYVGTEHLLLGLFTLGQGTAVKVLQKMGLDLETVRVEVEKQLGPGPQTRMVGNIPYTPRVKNVLMLAGKEAKALRHSYVGTEHILMGLLREGEGVAARVLQGLEIDIERTRNEILKELDPNFVPEGVPAQAGGKKPTPALRAFGRDLTELARKSELDPVIGRANEIDRVIQILCRRTRNNPMLIGETGIGKTSVIHGLSMRLASGNVPVALFGKTILTLDSLAMAAEARSRREFHDAIRIFLKEIVASRDDIILYIDDLAALFGAPSSEDDIDFSSILKAALVHRQFQCVGEATLGEYYSHVRGDAALERCFQIVQIEAPSIEETIQILKGLRATYEACHAVEFVDGSLDAAAALASRYLTDGVLPDKAIDIIDEAAVHARMRAEASPSSFRIEREAIERHIEKVLLQKRAAMKSQDFESAAAFRGDEMDTREKLELLLAKYRTEARQVVPVTENDVDEVVSNWTGISVSSLRDGTSFVEKQRLSADCP